MSITVLLKTTRAFYVPLLIFGDPLKKSAAETAPQIFDFRIFVGNRVKIIRINENNNNNITLNGNNGGKLYFVRGWTGKRYLCIFPIIYYVQKTG